MSGENPTSNPSQGSETGGGETLEQRFERFAEKVDARLGGVGKEIGKLRERVGGGAKPSGDEGSSGSGGGVSREDLAAALSVGRLSANLPDAARARVDALIEDGKYREARELAEFAKDLGGGSNAGGGGARPPKAGGAAGAKTGTGSHPTSMKELVEVQRADPERYKRLMADDTFDPTSLR